VNEGKMENEEVEKIITEIIKNQVALSNITINRKKLYFLITNVLTNLNQKNIELEKKIERLHEYMTLVLVLCLFIILIVSKIKG